MSGTVRASRIVGILGGMGPGATVDFYAKLVRHTSATTDQEHLRVVVWADPTIPSRQEALLSGGQDPTPWLREGVDRLVQAGAEIVVVPCNTIHAFLDPVMRGRQVEFISIVETTVEAVRRRGVATVCLLATDGALAAGLFQSAFDAVGISWRVPAPDHQRRLTALVETAKAAPADHRLKEELRDLLDDLGVGEGGEVCVAGCTEISALLDGGMPERFDIIDPALELALSTIARARA